MIRYYLIVIANLIALATSLQPNQQQRHDVASPSSPSIASTTMTPTTTTTTDKGFQSRRSLFSSMARTTIAAVATISSSYPQPAEAKLSFPWQKNEPTYTPYEDFKSMLLSDKLQQVEFGIDGQSLFCTISCSVIAF